MSFFEDASLVLIPSAQKLSKIYSVKPTDGTGDLAFTRSNDTATRVGPDGLIEKVRTNLILQSQTFENASWAKVGVGTGLAPVVTANAGAAPDGTTTADRIVFDTGAGTTSSDRSIFRQTISATIGRTGSFYIKSNTGSSQSVGFHDGAQSSIVTVTTSWQRFSVSILASDTFFGLENRGDNATAGTCDVLVWGAQLETGDIATDYIATTTAAVSVGPVANVPRLDYLNSSCPRLLLEPQRTNLATYSEQMNNAAWTKLQTSITANSIVSPDGFTNADTLTADGTSNEHQLRSTGVVTLTSGTTYTTSIFAKAGTNNFVQFIGSGIIYSGTTYANFNIATGVVGDVGAGTTASIVAYGNGWYRCSMTALANATDSTNTFLFNIVTSNTAVRGESNTLSTNVYLYGAQIEAGAYATSYIPTLGAAVTRGADAASKTSISSLIGQTEGTIYAEINFDLTVTASGDTRFQLSDGTGSNWIFLGIPDGSYFNRVRMYTNGPSGEMSVFSSNSLTSGVNKIAFGYKSGSFVLYINGTQAASSSLTITVPACSRVDLQGNGPTLPSATERTNYKQALLFKTRLTNAQLAELTTI